jgi:hypothetical protein
MNIEHLWDGILLIYYCTKFNYLDIKITFVLGHTILPPISFVNSIKLNEFKK